MRLHVLGLPWTETTRRYLHCAYTEKARKLADMMAARGHDVFLYAGAENEAACTEHVPLISRDERVGWFGEWDSNNLFEKIDWNPGSPWWRDFNSRAISAIGERAEAHDVVCLLTRTQDPVAEALPHLMPVESAVGYEGIRTGPYRSGTPSSRVFESYAWMHYLYGKWGIDDGFPFDDVVPNYFDRNDFVGEARPAGDYLLFVGRLVQRKGPHIAALIAERVGMRLVVAGPGATAVEPGRIVCPEVTIEGDHIDYVGPVDVEARAELMAGAAATIVPTVYVEPFGGVACEAMISGSPVVASDWGAFTETVPDGVGGYRFRTLAEGSAAVQDALTLDRQAVRDYALSRFSLEAVAPRFEAHFDRLATLWGPGWYA